MARNAMHDEVAADPRTIAHTYQGRSDRCRHSFNETADILWRYCARHGTWVIDDAGRNGESLVLCTQHAHAWIQAHPLVEGP